MLTAPRRTQKLATSDYGRSIAADTTIYQGAMVALDAAGNALPAGAVGTSSNAVGVAKETASNAGGAAGDKKVTTERGAFLFDNLAGDPVTAPMVDQACYVVDDHTVAATAGAGARRVAGKVFAVEPGGVWVEI